MLRKLFGLTVLSLLLVLVLCVSAQAAETQEISGQVKASELTDGADITLTGDTVLTLDADKSVKEILGRGNNLTIQGEKTITVNDMLSCDVTAADGTLEVGFLRGDNMTVSGGEVRVNVDLELMEEDGTYYYSQPLCFRIRDRLTVTGGILSIDGRTSGLNCGLAAEKITVSGGILDVRNCTTVAVCAGEMTVSGGEVYAAAKGTGISASNSISVFDNYVGLTVLGGAVEARGTNPGTTYDDGYSVGVAMPKVTVSGGTLTASGSVSAVNSNDPITLGEGVKVLTPEGGYAAAEPMLLEPSISQWNPNGWSGYSILNADGSRAVQATLSLAQEISGQVKASELTDGAKITLTGDTVLILDTDKTVDSIQGAGAWGEPGKKLTVQGEKSLSVGQIIRCDMTMSSGTLAVGYLEGPALTVSGGEVRGDLNLMPRLGGYGMPRCLNLHDSLTVNGGRITFDGGQGILCGIRAETVTVTDGYIDIKGCNYAAISTASMTVSGGEIHASSGLTGISNWDGIIGFEGDAMEEGRPYEPQGLCVKGGTVETTGTYSGEYVSAGVAMDKVTVLGGTLIASGSVSAINCAEPVQLGQGVKVCQPEGGYPGTEALAHDSAQWYWAWSDYSILNADGARAATAVISAFDEAGTLGENDELIWTYDETSDTVTVVGEELSANTPVIAASYDGNGKMISVSMVTASGDSAKVDGDADSISLFWLGIGGAPRCENAVVKNGGAENASR